MCASNSISASSDVQQWRICIRVIHTIFMYLKVSDALGNWTRGTEIVRHEPPLGESRTILGFALSWQRTFDAKWVGARCFRIINRCDNMYLKMEHQICHIYINEPNGCCKLTRLHYCFICCSFPVTTIIDVAVTITIVILHDTRATYRCVLLSYVGKLRPKWPKLNNNRLNPVFCHHRCFCDMFYRLSRRYRFYWGRLWYCCCCCCYSSWLNCSGLVDWCCLSPPVRLPW